MRYVPRRLERTADVSRGRFRFAGLAKGVVSAVVVLVLLYGGLVILSDAIVARISDETEASWFGFDLPGGADARLAPAREIFERLADACSRKLPYRLFLLDMEEPNAVAIPGGGVGVTPALLRDVSSTGGLAMVLAHELGHHHYRHALKRLGRTLLLSLATSFFLGELDVSIVDLVRDAAGASYSREQEREADRFGLRLVHRVYGTTEGCLEFFRDVREKYGGRDLPGLGIFATHPVTDERIRYLEEYGRELEAAGGGGGAAGAESEDR